MIIQPDFADSHDLRLCRELADGLKPAFIKIFAAVRMNPHRRKHSRILHGHL
jgi:hypothetical protein